MTAPRTYRFHIGDTRAVLATMPAQSVNCVVTSPPYLAKRAYLPSDHADKALEIGQEATPADFLAAQLEVMDLLWDVLADDGVAFVNLGDTASGSGGAGGDYSAGGLREGQQVYGGSARKRAEAGIGDEYRPARTGRPDGRRDRPADVAAGLIGDRKRPGPGQRDNIPGWPRSKSVCWMPELVGASLAYGRNLLSGESCRRWITRPSLTWCKPNPSVGAIFDKFREATELVIFAVKQPSYWFDLDPLRTAPVPTNERNTESGYAAPGQPDRKTIRTTNPLGAPPLNWQDDDRLPGALVASPAQYEGAHFAVMPPKLARMLVTCGCPPDGIVLDPFGGSGTTAEAAFGLGRSAVLIDLDERNVALAQERLGMWPLDVVDHRTVQESA